MFEDNCMLIYNAIFQQQRFSILFYPRTGILKTGKRMASIVIHEKMFVMFKTECSDAVDTNFSFDCNLHDQYTGYHIQIILLLPNKVWEVLQLEHSFDSLINGSTSSNYSTVYFAVTPNFWSYKNSSPTIQIIALYKSLVMTMNIGEAFGRS